MSQPLQQESNKSFEEALGEQLSSFLTLSAVLLRTHNRNLLIELIGTAANSLVPAVTYSVCHSSDNNTQSLLGTNNSLPTSTTIALPDKLMLDETAWVEPINQVVLTSEAQIELKINFLYALPIRNPMRRFGTLLIGTANRLQPIELRFLVSLADLGAIALESADHFDLLQQAVTENLIVNEVATALASSLNPEELFAVFLQKLKLYLPFDRASLALLDPDQHSLHVLFNWNPLTNRVHRVPLTDFQLANTVLELAVQKQELVFNPPIVTDAEAQIDPVFATDMLSHILIPLMNKGKVTGTLTLASRSNEIYADVSHLPVSLLEKLAAHLALAFSNSLLYEEQQISAETDSRLGVYNHNYFDRQIKIELKKAGQQNYRLGLLMIDMDYLKAINDSYGHQAGDAALQHLAQIISQSVRITDVVARYGGDEFVVLLAGCTPRGLAIVSEKIRRTVRTSPVTVGETLKIPFTVSIGGAIYPDDAVSATDLINKADAALYIAKRRRDQVRLGTKARVVRLKAAELDNSDPERELPEDFETELRQSS